MLPNRCSRVRLLVAYLGTVGLAVASLADPVRDFACDVEARIVTGEHSLVALLFKVWSRPPDRIKWTLVSRLASPDSRDFFNHKVGITYLLTGNRLYEYQPFLEKVHETDLSAIPESFVINQVWGTGDLPNIHPLLRDGWRAITQEGERLTRVLPSADDEGLQKYKVTLASPLYVSEAHRVVWYECWVQPDVKGISHLVGYDPEDRPVIQITCHRFTPLGSGGMIPLEVHVDLAAGSISLEHLFQVTQGKETRQEVLRDKYPVPARKVIRRFFLPDPAILLPREVLVYEENSLRLHLVFRDCRVNTGLEDTLFAPPSFCENPPKGERVNPEPENPP